MFKTTHQLNFSLIYQMSFGFLITLALLIPSVSHSHEFLAQLQSQNQSFVPVIYHQLDKEQMVQITGENPAVDYYDEGDGFRPVQREIVDECKSSGSRTCGQFDHVSVARSAAIITCYQIGQEQAELYPGGLIPFYTGPNSFVINGVPSPDHHSKYKLDHGISFSCGYMLTQAQ